MNLKDFDFSKCRYSPLAKMFLSSLSKSIPAFGEYDKANRRAVFTYVVILYDKNSPLWAKEPQYFPRKVLAINLSGLAVLTHAGDFNETTRGILEGRDANINKLVVAYLANMGDMEYTQLINELTYYYGLSEQMMGPSLLGTAEYKMQKELSQTIAERTRKIFGSGEEDELSRVKNLLYARAEQDRQKLHPEAVVKLWESKKGVYPNHWGRYGQYEVEPLKFAGDVAKGTTTGL
jgi:hypothetical protein